MCFTEKCKVPVDLGSILIGYLTFILSSIITLLSIIILIIEKNNPSEGFYYIHTIVNLDLTPSSIKILVTIIALAELFLAVFSVLLIVGVKKNKPNLVLSYFAYGVFMTILCSLSGLLLLITGHWEMAIMKFIAVIVFTHFLIVVHSTYDLMMRGELPTIDEQFETDEELLVESAY